MGLKNRKMKNPNRELFKLNRFKPGKEREEFLTKVKIALAEYRRRWEAGEITRYESQHRPNTLARDIGGTKLSSKGKTVNKIPDRIITAIMWVIDNREERVWVAGRQYPSIARNGLTAGNEDEMSKRYDTSPFASATATPELREKICEDFKEWVRTHPEHLRKGDPRKGPEGPPGFLGPKYGFTSDQARHFGILLKHAKAEEYQLRFIEGESIEDLWDDYKACRPSHGKPKVERSVKPPLPSRQPVQPTYAAFSVTATTTFEDNLKKITIPKAGFTNGARKPIETANPSGAISVDRNYNPDWKRDFDRAFPELWEKKTRYGGLFNGFLKERELELAYGYFLRGHFATNFELWKTKLPHIPEGEIARMLLDVIQSKHNF
jgi:hypothetical protein